MIGKHFNSNLIGPDVVQFNAGHIDNVDSTDPWDTTRAMAIGRQIAEQYLEALKEVRPKAFGSAFVVKTASLLGVRDSRRIEGVIRLLSRTGWNAKRLKMRSDVTVTILMFISQAIKKHVTKKGSRMESLIVV